MAVDGLGEHGEELVDDVADLFGVQALGHGGKTDELGEHDRHDPAIAQLVGAPAREGLGVRPRSRACDRRPALDAEASVRQERGIAGLASLGRATGAALAAELVGRIELGRTLCAGLGMHQGLQRPHQGSGIQYRILLPW
ncbi:hypothetical protein D3C86_1605960 [compost metagenome]